MQKKRKRNNLVSGERKAKLLQEAFNLSLITVISPFI